MIKAGKQKTLLRKAHSRQILVPIDFSDASKRALAHAVSLAGEGSHLILLHVISPLGQSDHELSSSLGTARKKLADFIKSDGIDHDHSLQSLVRTGAPFQEILATAQENDVELIVLGVHDSGPLDGVELGHTVDRVSRYARCPVLLVRESEADKTSTPQGSPRK